MARIDELYYCGTCDRTQLTTQGERCSGCNGPTVAWNPVGESRAKARENFQRYTGEPPKKREPTSKQRRPYW